MLFAEHKKTGFWADKNMMLPAPASARAGCAEHGGVAVPSPESILANVGRSDDGVQRPPGCGMFTCEALFQLVPNSSTGGVQYKDSALTGAKTVACSVAGFLTNAGNNTEGTRNADSGTLRMPMPCVCRTALCPHARSGAAGKGQQATATDPASTRPVGSASDVTNAAYLSGTDQDGRGTTSTRADASDAPCVPPCHPLLLYSPRGLFIIIHSPKGLFLCHHRGVYMCADPRVVLRTPPLARHMVPRVPKMAAALGDACLKWQSRCLPRPRGRRAPS